MFKTRKFFTMLAVALIAIGALAVVQIGGIGFGPVLAALDAPVEAHKSVSVEEAAPGQTVGYTIVLTNTSGAVVDGLEVSDVLDTDLTYVSGSDDVQPVGSAYLSGLDTGVVTFTVNSMDPDDVVTITFNADLSPTATPAVTISNVAKVYSGTVNIVDTNDAYLNVSPMPSLQIYSPDSGSVVTQRPEQTLEISGRAWTQSDPAPFPEAPVLSPIAATGTMDYLVDWSDAADAVRYVWYESTDPEFATISDSGTVMAVDGSSTFVTGKAAGTFYYRVRAYAADPTRYSRYSNVVAVTVTSSGVTSSSVDQALTSQSQLSLAAVSDLITVEVSTDGGTVWNGATLTENASGWWDWSYDWELPEGDEVETPIMARASYTAGGDYGTDTITVTLDNSALFVYMPIIFKHWPPVPFAPTLNSVSTIDDDERDLRLTWSYYDGTGSVPDPFNYQLQEATDSDFTENLVSYTVSGTSKDLLDKSGGTYYYRVRGQNTYGYGIWSAVQSKVVQVTTYEFDSDDAGWALTRSDDGPGDLLEPVYKDGLMYHLVHGSYDFSILSPMEEGPSAPYTIEAKVDFIDNEEIDPYDYGARELMGYGFIFGGNSGTPCPVDRDDDGGCLDHYYRILVTWMGDNLVFKLKRIDGHAADGKGYSDGETLLGPKTISHANALGWNEWRIEVEEDGDIKIYVNGYHQGTGNDTEYLDDGYFGTYMETAPHGDAGTKWDYFRIE